MGFGACKVAARAPLDQVMESFPVICLE